MFSITKDDITIIPLSYNLFLQTLKKAEDVPRFTKENNISNDFMDQILSFTNGLLETQYVGVDMKYVLSYSSRAFSRFLSCNNKDKIFFYNINEDSNLGNKICEDLSFTSENYRVGSRDFLSFLSLPSSMSICNYKDVLQSLVDERIAESIHGIIDEIDLLKNEPDEPHFLDSSGVYSNMYVNLKKIFCDAMNSTYIVYKMTEIAQTPEFMVADALISTSKTGAVFANLIGQLLKKKAVHCVGIGPKFALSIDQLKKEVRAGKKYLYIYDFICLGTEVKILNALLKSENADLIGGVGVATYVDTNDVHLSDSVIGKMKCLTNVVKSGENYRIATSKEELRCQLQFLGKDMKI